MPVCRVWWSFTCLTPLLLPPADSRNAAEDKSLATATTVTTAAAVHATAATGDVQREYSF